MNELELLDDFVVEDVTAEDIEKQLLLKLFSSLDEMLISQDQFEQLMTTSNIAVVISSSFKVRNSYIEYLDYCRENMEM